jgi:hypothetical protein
LIRLDDSDWLVVFAPKLFVRLNKERKKYIQQSFHIIVEIGS